MGEQAENVSRLPQIKTMNLNPVVPELSAEDYLNMFRFPDDDHKLSTVNTLPESSEKCSFKCAECGKEFSNKYALKSHRKVHSTEKPYPCKYCGKFFKRRHDSYRHRRRFHFNAKDGGELSDTSDEARVDSLV